MGHEKEGADWQSIVLCCSSMCGAADLRGRVSFIDTKRASLSYGTCGWSSLLMKVNPVYIISVPWPRSL